MQKDSDATRILDLRKALKITLFSLMSIKNLSALFFSYHLFSFMGGAMDSSSVRAADHEKSPDPHPEPSRAS